MVLKKIKLNYVFFVLFEDLRNILTAYILKKKIMPLLGYMFFLITTWLHTSVIDDRDVMTIDVCSGKYIIIVFSCKSRPI